MNIYIFVQVLYSGFQGKGIISGIGERGLEIIEFMTARSTGISGIISVVSSKYGGVVRCCSLSARRRLIAASRCKSPPTALSVWRSEETDLV
jgi:hypothetical protein